MRARNTITAAKQIANGLLKATFTDSDEPHDFLVEVAAYADSRKAKGPQKARLL